MPKKVLFVITKSVWGGAQRYVYDLATSLPVSPSATQGGPTTSFLPIVAAGGSGELFEKLETANIHTIKIKFLERDVNLIKEMLSLVSLFKILKSERPDIVHLNSSKIGALGAIAVWLYKLSTRNYKLKTIFTVHGWAFNEDRNFISKIMIFISQWLTSALCDKIVVISKHDYRQALKIPLIKQGKFALVPLGIPAEKINFLTKEKSRKLISKMIGEEIAMDDIVVGAISELTKNKGVSYLIGAAEKLKNSQPKLKCVVIGHGEERDDIRNKINSSGLANTVHLTGFLNNANEYLKGFDVFALPSVKEGLPYVLLEAMSAGLPIAATAVGGVPDLIEHRQNGFLASPKNQTAFANAIESALLQKKSHGVKNIHSEKLKTKFSLEQMIANTIKMYES